MIKLIFLLLLSAYNANCQTLNENTYFVNTANNNLPAYNGSSRESKSLQLTVIIRNVKSSKPLLEFNLFEYLE